MKTFDDKAEGGNFKSNDAVVEDEKLVGIWPINYRIDLKSIKWSGKLMKETKEIKLNVNQYKHWKLVIAELGRKWLRRAALNGWEYVERTSFKEEYVEGTSFKGKKCSFY